MGVGESIKGAVKGKLGELTDNEQLEAEGEAQQAKGNEETRETEAKAEAKAHEKKADALQKEQDSLDS